MNDHTPGPWVFVPAGNRPEITADNDRVLIARVESLNPVADARLIARAPEMAAEIERLTARVAELEAIGNQLEAEALDYATQNKELREAGQEVLHLSDRKHAAWDRLRAAITKGESND